MDASRMPHENSQSKAMPKEAVEYYLWLRINFASALNGEMADIMARKAYEIFTAPEK